MKTTTLGFPNAYQLKIKKAVEGFWRGNSTADDIAVAEQEVIAFNQNAQSNLDLTPVFDIDIYDRFLRTATLFGLVAKRFGSAEQVRADVSAYLSIARGSQDAPASAMVKWFNTNYHVVQPEIEQDPKLGEDVKLPEVKENQKLALIGPWTLLSYSFNKTDQDKQTLFSKLSAEYIKLINQLPENAIVQLEEPSFITDGMPEGYKEFVEQLNPRIHLHVYFGAVNNFADKLFVLPVEGIGLDFFEGPANLELLESFPKDKILIAGVINGRNVRPATTQTKKILEKITSVIADDKLYISPSCSLLHVPVSAEGEDENFAFALEKIKELEAIKDGTINYLEAGAENADLTTDKFERNRKDFWVSETAYPTTTIGSFPQTKEVRKQRKAWKDQEITDEEYENYIKNYIKDCVTRQDKLGLDVLVHGEPERNDMVQYFAENFDGITPIKGWVQSYGTRYVRPPVITGPVSRPQPFTVKWITYAQSQTDKPVKGMLTGPVTIVQWSFPREDISREAQYYDVATALADEVDDLAKAGVKHIQIDEPAIREGLPLDPAKHKDYLFHAVNAFRSCYANVPDDVIVHSHICFSEFSDIMDAIRDLGVDVLSIEDSKAKGKTAKSVQAGGFPGSIGLGVFDVHSPRIPSVGEMTAIPDSLDLDPKRIWINPDCGLKTRGEEAWTQLGKMMEAVGVLRDKLNE